MLQRAGFSKNGSEKPGEKEKEVKNPSSKFQKKQTKSNRRMNMKKVLQYSFWTVVAFLASATMALAAEAAPGAAVDYTKAIVLGCSVIAAGLAMGLGAIGAGQGMGQATSGGSVAVGRNPEAQGKIMLTMMVGLAMTESIAIYALVISLVILYANPIIKLLG
jgi:F-type H+-transporting ATPase subunit c